MKKSTLNSCILKMQNTSMVIDNNYNKMKCKVWHQKSVWKVRYNWCKNNYYG